VIAELSKAILKVREVFVSNVIFVSSHLGEISVLSGKFYGTEILLGLQ
jgi:hypothetical protein